MNNMTAPPMTSPGSASGSGETGIDRLFRKLASHYGRHWLAMWEGIPTAKVKADWVESLRGFKSEEIQRGLDGCDARPFPPTLPEFKALCRPPVDYRTAFHEAQRNQERRDAGKLITWSSKAVYWTFAGFGGNEIKHMMWSRDNGRWTAAMDAILADERDSGLPDIPPVRPALARPGKTSVDAEQARQRIAVAAGIISPGKDPKAWAKRIIANPKAYPDISVSSAHIALGWRHDD